MRKNGGSGGATVVFGCPACGRAVELEPGGKGPCPRCGAEASLSPVPPHLAGCVACGCPEIYRQRDFNQKLGLSLVALGVVLWIALGSFWPMVAAAAIDLLLWFSLPDVAICYRCKAHHRGFDGIRALPRFDLERFEHYRFERSRKT